MLISEIRPSTVAGVKRLASQLKKQHGIKHSDALNQAARAAGKTNFRHALQTLPIGGYGPQNLYVLLTIYWSDKKLRHQCGRETLRIDLSKPILEICTKSLLKYVRGFGNLRMVAADHLVCDSIAPTQEYARERLCTAERSLRFMEYTGLRPSRDLRKLEPRGLDNEKLPSLDHSTRWVEPETGHYFLVDEPYGGAPDEAERAAWAARNGWRIEKTSWPGMYSPYDCDLYVAVDTRYGSDIEMLVEKINALPDPLVAKNWDGESLPSWETFVSPMAKSEQDKRRARCKGMIYPLASKTTVPYNYNPGTSRRRPIGKLGIEGHIEAGRIIKGVMRSAHSPAVVFSRMSSLRSELEDWLSLEIENGELEGPEFFEVYYSDTKADKAYQVDLQSSGDVIASLQALGRKLTSAYPDCAPLRKQLRRIEGSIAMIEVSESKRQ